MEGDNPFDRNAEERTRDYFSFSASVFHWCRVVLIPVAALYAAMMAYGYRQGISPAGGVLFLLCLVAFTAILPKRERAWRQYAREAQAAIDRGSVAPYSPKALALRDAQQRAGRGVHYLIAGMVILLGLLCLAGGVAIMWMGGSLIFWGSPILLLALPCFLLGVFYIRMGRAAPKSSQ